MNHSKMLTTRRRNQKTKRRLAKAAKKEKKLRNETGEKPSQSAKEERA
jgi:hypothetical protein